jgi:hypothetical protein
LLLSLVARSGLQKSRMQAHSTAVSALYTDTYFILQ